MRTEAEMETVTAAIVPIPRTPAPAVIPPPPPPPRIVRHRPVAALASMPRPRPLRQDPGTGTRRPQSAALGAPPADENQTAQTPSTSPYSEVTGHLFPYEDHKSEWMQRAIDSPMDEGYYGSPARGLMRLREESPYSRSVGMRTEAEMECISNLVDFLGRPPRIVRHRPVVALASMPRPRPLRQDPGTGTRRPPSAALGAPPADENQTARTPSTLPYSDISMVSTDTISPPPYSEEDPFDYSEEDEDEEDELEENQYYDPDEERDAWSFTPPSACDHPDHPVCVPPAWGERIPGIPLGTLCLICYEDDTHHPIPCLTARPSQQLYPEPSAPPMDEGYYGSPARGVMRPWEESPYSRSVRMRTEAEMEMVTAAIVPIPRTPAPAVIPPRPPPPRIVRHRPVAALASMPRPRPLRQDPETGTRRPPSAALGAPPADENQTARTPSTSPYSDISMVSTDTISSPPFSEEDPFDYSEEDEDEEDELEENQYYDPDEERDAWSITPPSACDHPDHPVCVPPAWGERIPGIPLGTRCQICYEDDTHQPIRCLTARPSWQLYPEPSAPPMDERYYGSPARGVMGPREESPYSRSVRMRTEAEMEMVTAAIVPIPRTPAPAVIPPRPPPPRIVRHRPVAALASMPRPRPLRQDPGTGTRRPQSAALGAPPADENQTAQTPSTSPYSEVTGHLFPYEDHKSEWMQRAIDSPMDEGYYGSPARGVMRLREESPYSRSVGMRTEAEMECISNLVDFSGRPPRIVRHRPVVALASMPRPRPLRQDPGTGTRRPPSAALGAPPADENQTTWTPSTSPYSDITIVSTDIISPPPYSEEDPFDYSEEDEDEGDELDEYQYYDPDEERDAWSLTPPPACDHPDHPVCVPPAWGERIPGIPLGTRCQICYEDNTHHPIRCRGCRKAPACCSCIWWYMRARYNSGCPLCRHGDPGDGNNPLAITRSVEIRSGRGRGRGRGVVTWTRGRGSRGRGGR